MIERYNINNLYTKTAINIAETYGIVKYKISGKYFIWNVSFPAYLNNKRYTVQHIIDMDTMEEQTKTLKRYDKDGEYNR